MRPAPFPLTEILALTPLRAFRRGVTIALPFSRSPLPPEHRRSRKSVRSRTHVIELPPFNMTVGHPHVPAGWVRAGQMGAEVLLRIPALDRRITVSVSNRRNI